MLNILKKIITTGTVAENWKTTVPPARSRGEVVVQTTACHDCHKCSDICPTGAIKITAGSLAINQKACIFCGRCVENCAADCLAQTNNYRLATLGGVFDVKAGDVLKNRIRQILGRSLNIRHVDAGSCNACDFEISHLANPIYDVQQYGIDLVASPRHADMLMVTGVVTRNSVQALQMTYEATPGPKVVMAVGACACSGQVFGDSYAILGAVDAVIPVDIYVPGCPPRPQALIHGIMLALNRL